MAPLDDDERQALIDGLHRAVARAEAICARAELACRDAQAVRAFNIRDKVTASRVLSPRGAARLMNDLDAASRDLETLSARIESVKPKPRTPRLRRRRESVTGVY
jgi:hypothetical protein